MDKFNNCIDKLDSSSSSRIFDSSSSSRIFDSSSTSNLFDSKSSLDLSNMSNQSESSRESHYLLGDDLEKKKDIDGNDINNKVYFENVISGIMHLIDVEDTTIEEQLHGYIKLRYGKKNLNLAINYGNNSLSTVESITAKKEFENGVFYIKLMDGKYELYKKVTEYEDKTTWLSGNYKESTFSIEKVRVYGLIRV
jgi:hypothetical protein